MRFSVHTGVTFRSKHHQRDNPGETDLMMRNTNTGAFEVCRAAFTKIVEPLRRRQQRLPQQK
jgi:hypothetical protein